MLPAARLTVAIPATWALAPSVNELPFATVAVNVSTPRILRNAASATLPSFVRLIVSVPVVPESLIVSASPKRVEVPYRYVSEPSPPSRLSTPAPPVSESLPAPPTRVSARLPPTRVSLAEPPVTLTLKFVVTPEPSKFSVSDWLPASVLFTSSKRPEALTVSVSVVTAASGSLPLSIATT